MSEHRNAEALIGIAQRKPVQYRMKVSSFSSAKEEWSEWINWGAAGVSPEPTIESSYYQWRVKPDPKPDMVKHVPIYTETFCPLSLDTAKRWHPNAKDFIKITIDGETGKPKSVEIVE